MGFSYEDFKKGTIAYNKRFLAELETADVAKEAKVDEVAEEGKVEDFDF